MKETDIIRCLKKKAAKAKRASKNYREAKK